MNNSKPGKKTLRKCGGNTKSTWLSTPSISQLNSVVTKVNKLCLQRSNPTASHPKFWALYPVCAQPLQSCPTLCDPMDCRIGQSPLSMGFSRQEYWSALPFPSPGDLPNPRIKPRSPALQADSLPSELPGKPGCVPWRQPKKRKKGREGIRREQWDSQGREMNWRKIYNSPRKLTMVRAAQQCVCTCCLWTARARVCMRVRAR